MGIADTYMTDSVTITPRGTAGGSGQFAYDGTPVATTARVDDKMGVRQRDTGKEYVYQFRLWMKSTEALALQDKITYNSKTHVIREIEEQDDVGGALDHYVVYCG